MKEIDKDFYIENFETYHGEVTDVIKIIEHCPSCGEKFILTHFSDCTHLYVEETAKCFECDFGARKIYHSLN